MGLRLANRLRGDNEPRSKLGRQSWRHFATFNKERANSQTTTPRRRRCAWTLEILQDCRWPEPTAASAALALRDAVGGANLRRVSKLGNDGKGQEEQDDGPLDWAEE